MTDLINHPPHYTSHPSGVECIDGDLLDALVRQLAWYDKHEILIATVAA